MKKFEVGKKYLGSEIYGDCEMIVIKRTSRTILFQTGCGTFEGKISSFHADSETLSHRAWVFSADKQS